MSCFMCGGTPEIVGDGYEVCRSDWDNVYAFLVALEAKMQAEIEGEE